MSKYIRTNLSYLRFSRGRLSQKAVSKSTGIGQKTLSALETGASKGIEFNTLLKLCMFFECSPSQQHLSKFGLSLMLHGPECRK